MPKVCPNCKTPGLITKGFGTEKIEDEIKVLFPEARVQRMDFDTTRSRKSFQKIISDFEDHKTDILIGTQMVTKGLDFQKVSLVGILNADNMLHFPDFRANERAFQLITQVSGRAGRKFKRGVVVLQTSSPDHPVISQVLHHDYALMYDTQCAERQAFRYPPFFRMIEITLKHKESQIVSRAASEMHQMMSEVFGMRVLGPVVPAISRIQNYYLRQLVLKIETEASHTKAKEILMNITQQILLQQDFKSIKLSIDVDPN
jgi:primosomal protein N' (replication factor Y)